MYGKRTTNGNQLRINNGALQMVGKALRFPSPKRLKVTNTGQHIGLPLKSSNSFFEADGRYEGNQKTHSGGVLTVPKAGNDGENRSPSLPQLEHDEKDLVNTEITEIGQPLDFGGKYPGSQVTHSGSVLIARKANDEHNTSPPLPQVGHNEKDLATTEITQTEQPLTLGAGNDSYGGMRYGDADREHDNEFAVKANNSNNNPMNRYYPNLASEPKPVHRQRKNVQKVVQGKPPFSGKGSQNDRLHYFLKSVHNTRTAPLLPDTNLPLEEQTHEIQVVPQGNQLTNESPSNGYFKNKTIYYKQNDKKMQATSQNNLGNVSRESQEVIGGYGADDVKDERMHPFPRINDPEISSLKAPSQVTEQNQATVNVINGPQKTLGQRQYDEGHDTGIAFTNVHSSEMRNKQGNKEVNTERYDDDKEQYSLSREESNSPEEDQVYSLQKAENSDPGGKQGGFTVGYPLDDKNLPGLAQPSVQGYMPVDEFGSPFYGNETGKLFLFTKDYIWL